MFPEFNLSLISKQNWLKRNNYEVQLIWKRTQGRPIRRLPDWQLSGLAVVVVVAAAAASAVVFVVVVVVAAAAAAAVDDNDDDDSDRNVWSWWSGWYVGVRSNSLRVF